MDACEALKSQGFRTVREYVMPYPRGTQSEDTQGRLDAFGQKDNTTVALEVETGAAIRVSSIRKLIISNADLCIIIHGGGYRESEINDHAMNYARKTFGRVRFPRALERVSEIRFQRGYKITEEQFADALDSLSQWNTFKGQIFIIDVSSRRNFKVTLDKEEGKTYCFLERIETTDHVPKPHEYGRQEPMEVGEVTHFPEFNVRAVLMDTGYYHVKQGDEIGEPLHRLVARKFIFRKYPLFFKSRYPRFTWEDFDVHHVDRNKTNNEPNNLVIISRAEHRVKILHDKIHDRASGIKELQRVGIHAPHIPELMNY